MTSHNYCEDTGPPYLAALRLRGGLRQGRYPPLCFGPISRKELCDIMPSLRSGLRAACRSLVFVCRLTQPALCSGAALSATTPVQVFAPGRKISFAVAQGGNLQTTQWLRVGVLSGSGRMRALTLCALHPNNPAPCFARRGARARIERTPQWLVASKEAVTSTARRGESLGSCGC